MNRRDVVPPSDLIKSDTCGADRRRDPVPNYMEDLVTEAHTPRELHRACCRGIGPATLNAWPGRTEAADSALPKCLEH